MQAAQALQFRFTTFAEVNAGAGDEIANDTGNEHLAAGSFASDTCRVVDGSTEEVIVFVDRVAGVDLRS